MQSVLLSISIALIVGLVMSRIVKPIGLPAVTGYLVGGILVGPYVLGRLGIPGIGFNTMEEVDNLKILSEIALGFIAFSIGNEFRLSQLKTIGKKVIIIGIVQAITATIMVDLVLYIIYIFNKDIISLPAILTLGAIATATAPAATLMVVQQYKAKGKLTEILLPVVALDDAVGLIVFAISFGIAKIIASGEYSLTSILLEPFFEITYSILIGWIIGSILTYSEQKFHSRAKRTSTIVAIVLLSVAISMITIKMKSLNISLSSLLICMMVGTTFCNESEEDFSNNMMERIDRWSTPITILFFVISGSGLEFSVFKDPKIIIIGIVFILARSFGKYLGSYLSAKFTGCDKDIQKYLGITLLPQAGVALGMCIKAKDLADGTVIRNIILFAVLIYELIGPYLTKKVLIKSGDIDPKNL